MGVKYQLRAATLLPLILISLLFAICYNWQFNQYLEREISGFGHTFIHQLIPASEYALLNNDRRTLQGLINASLTNTDIKSIAFYDKNKKLIAYRGINTPTTLSKKNIKHLTSKQINLSTLRFTTPIVLPGENLYASQPTDLDSNSLHDLHSAHSSNVLGYLSLDVDTQANTIKQYRMIIITMFLTFFGLVLGLIINHFLSVKIYKPINRLRRSMKQILNNEFETTIKHVSKGEIGLIEKGSKHLQTSYLNLNNDFNNNVEQQTQDLQQNLEALEEKNVELCLAIKKLETQDKQKSEFISNMSHEIRTPMNGIIGFTNVLLETPISPSQKEYVNTIKTSAHNLLNIINDILDYSKIEADKLKLDNIPMDVRSCIDEVLTLLAPGAQKKHLSIDSIVKSNVPLQVLGDPLRFKQVITNLVGNAIKFTEKGHVIVRITHKLLDNKKVQMHISVEDTGMGLNPDEQKKLFKAFQQADISTTRRFGGTGLGLAISQKLVEKMKGKIELNSTPGVGSTFHFYIQTEILGHGAPNEGFYQHLNNKTLLCYDDNPFSLEALSENAALRKLTLIKTSTAHAFKQSFFAKDKVDLILFCLDSPTAKQLIQFIEAYNHRNIPIVFTTSQTDFVPPTNSSYFYLNKPLGYKKLYDCFDYLLVHKDRFELENSSPETNLPANRKDILLADDCSVNRSLITALTNQLNINLTTCYDGEQALNLSYQYHYDLIILDLQMPKRGGLSVAKTIRKNSQSNNLNQFTAIVAISADIDSNQHNALKEAGVNAWLQKPFAEKAILDSIQYWSGLKDSTSINWQQCIDKMNGNETFAQEMLDKFVEQLSQEKEQLITHFQKQELNTINAIAHRLHGACYYCGVPQLQQAIYELEKNTLNNDISKLSYYLTNAVITIDQVESCYHNLFKDEEKHDY
jgi:two-component system sensor histidine kinase BarA